MRPEVTAKPNPFTLAQTAHLRGVRQGTVVENRLSGTIAEVEEVIDHTRPRIRVSYRDAYSSRLRYTTWWAKHIRIIPPADRRKRVPR